MLVIVDVCLLGQETVCCYLTEQTCGFFSLQNKLLLQCRNTSVYPSIIPDCIKPFDLVKLEINELTC